MRNIAHHHEKKVLIRRGTRSCGSSCGAGIDQSVRLLTLPQVFQCGGHCKHSWTFLFSKISSWYNGNKQQIMKEKATAKINERQMDVAKTGWLSLVLLICLGVKGVQVFYRHVLWVISREMTKSWLPVWTQMVFPKLWSPKQDETINQNRRKETWS